MVLSPAAALESAAAVSPADFSSPMAPGIDACTWITWSIFCRVENSSPCWATSFISSSAVVLMSRVARSTSGRPGSCTTMRLSPSFVMDGSDTPNWSTRLRITLMAWFTVSACLSSGTPSRSTSSTR